MSEYINAIFENGVFRPEVPVNLPNGERVSLNVERQSKPADNVTDVDDLLDFEFMEACRQKVICPPSLEEVRQVLSAFRGSLADRISEERDER